MEKILEKTASKFKPGPPCLGKIGNGEGHQLRQVDEEHGNSMAGLVVGQWVHLALQVAMNLGLRTNDLHVLSEVQVAFEE